MNRETFTLLFALISVIVAVAIPEIRCYLGLQRDSCPGVKISLPKVVTIHAGSLPVPIPEMVTIHAGSFRMGDIRGTGNSDEQPVHTVMVKSFEMSRHEVTFEEYDYFAEQTGREKPTDEGWGTWQSSCD